MARSTGFRSAPHGAVRSLSATVGPRVLPVDIYYRTYATYLVLSQLFQVDEATICRAIRRISPLAQRLLQIKPERLLQSNELKLMIVDATEQRIERPKNQRDYYSGKKHAHTIKTEIVTDPSGKILRVSKPYEGRVHDFEIRKREGNRTCSR